MVMPGFKAYDIKCLSCGYEKMIPIRSTIPSGIDFLDKFKLPTHCPDCGEKLSIKENKMVKF